MPLSGDIEFNRRAKIYVSSNLGGVVLDYREIVSLAPEEFEEIALRGADLDDESKFTKVTDEEIAKIERLLDLAEGTLTDREMYLEYFQCPCGRVLTMYDFAVSALVAGHHPSFLLNTLVGNKYIINPPRSVRCSVSGHCDPSALRYRTRTYSCNPTVIR